MFRKPRNKDGKTGRKPQVNVAKECLDNKQETQEEEEEKEPLDIWFDNVDPILLEETQVKKGKKEKQTDSLKSVVKPAGNSLVEEESPDGWVFLVLVIFIVHARLIKSQMTVVFKELLSTDWIVYM